MMMIPRRNDFDLFEDMFGDAFFTKGESKLMKTDIKEKKDKYIIDVDLPGYEKDGIKLNIQEGYLTIHATVNKEEKDEELKSSLVSGDVEEYDDPLYNEIVEFVITSGKASASLLQRKFRLGYNRAARCIDLLEERGIIGPQNGSKPREVLVKLEDNNNNE